MLNGWVTRDEGNAAASNSFDDLAEVEERSGQPVDLVDDHDVDPSRANGIQQQAVWTGAAFDEYRWISTGPAVGAQYGGTHVYVATADMAPFLTSFTATFGGQSAKPVTTTVTPTPSSTIFEAVQTPAGSLSVFAFTTPIPYPFQPGGPVTSSRGIVTQRRACGPTDGPIAKRMQKISYAGYRFPPEIIHQAIWLGAATRQQSLRCAAALSIMSCVSVSLMDMDKPFAS